MNIGEKIARLRKQNNMTQEELANKLNVTPQAVSKWENGITSPDISLLPVIANLFHISTDELLGLQAPRAYQAIANEDMSKLLLKIKVLSSDGDKVNVNLPLALISLLMQGNMKIGSSDALSNIDWSAVKTAVEGGLRGKIVEINSADGDYVEIIVE